MSNNWIAVASADHVRRGVAGGFMQVCHGKVGLLRRVKPGDWVAYYSPTVAFGTKQKLQAFTAIGVVNTGVPYSFDMGGGFLPFRRDVTWSPARESPIQPLLSTLEFTAGRTNWGYQLRFGIFKVSDQDRWVITSAMGAASTPHPNADVDTQSGTVGEPDQADLF